MLRDLKSEFPMFIGDVDGLGMAFRIEICGEDGFTPNQPAVAEIVREAMNGNINVGGEEFGLVLDVGGYYKNVLTLAPSLGITYEEMELAVELLKEVFKRVWQPEQRVG